MEIPVSRAWMDLYHVPCKPALFVALSILLRFNSWADPKCVQDHRAERRLYGIPQYARGELWVSGKVTQILMSIHL